MCFLWSQEIEWALQISTDCVLVSPLQTSWMLNHERPPPLGTVPTDSELSSAHTDGQLPFT